MKRAVQIAGRLFVWVFAFMLVASFADAQELAKTAAIEGRGLTASDFPRIKKLADNVYSYEQLHPVWKNVTCDSGIIVTSEGVVIVDGQGNPALVKRMVEDIKKLTPQPIKYVVIGSEHGDHTGGNSAFPQDVTFIATPKSKAALETQAKAPNLAPNASKIVVPQETVSDKKLLKMGPMEIQILFLGRAHTGGDLEVYLPKEKILFTSETFFNRLFPSAAAAYPREWLDVIKKEQRMDAEMYVPGHGFIDEPKVMKEELTEYRKALEAVIAEGKRLHDARVPVEEAMKQASFGPYDSWTRKAEHSGLAIKRVYDELDGKLK